MIDLYTWPTPNGHKVQIMLEEIDARYRVVPVDITEGQQFSPEYLALNPNNKIPTIVDHEGPRGPSYPVFESGAILMYLAEKHGKLLPVETGARYEAIQWLMWQMGGLGPMFGQAQHFFCYAPLEIPYAIERYTREGQRLLGVLDARLEECEFIAREYSIADIACFPWVRIHKMANLSLDGFPNVTRWYSAVRARPAVGRGLDVLRDLWKDVRQSDTAKHNLFGRNRDFSRIALT